MINETSPPGWEGTIKAMIQHHPDKFGKDGDLNPYAIAWSKKKKGEEPHYKDSSPPKKKNKFKEWLNDWEESHKEATKAGFYSTSNPDIWSRHGKFVPRLGKVFPTLKPSIST